MIEQVKKSAFDRMEKSIISFKDELKKIRTGRAHPDLLEHISIEHYGSEVPFSQVASITVEDSRNLVISPWDKQTVAVIEKAILVSDLGLTPVTAGAVIRVPLPPMTEDRRRDLAKIVKGELESAKVAVRNIRRDALNDIKDLLKDKEITEDDLRKSQDEVQKYTDDVTSRMDNLSASKEEEIMEF